MPRYPERAERVYEEIKNVDQTDANDLATLPCKRLRQREHETYPHSPDHGFSCDSSRRNGDRWHLYSGQPRDVCALVYNILKWVMKSME